MNIKENTVKKSLLRIYDKLGVSNRIELVLYALAHHAVSSVGPIPAVLSTAPAKTPHKALSSGHGLSDKHSSAVVLENVS